MGIHLQLLLKGKVKQAKIRQQRQGCKRQIQTRKRLAGLSQGWQQTGEVTNSPEIRSQGQVAENHRVR